MNQLFIRRYVDEDVDVLVADMIRARGFQALTTQEAGRKKKADGEQLAFAASQQSALVTHNRADFEALAQKYFTEEKPHCGIIVGVRRSPQEIARRLLVILNHVTAEEMMNQVRYI